MPSATDKLQNKIRELFGDLDLAAPEEYLILQGYTITDGFISKQDVTEIWEMTQQELICVMFLVEEWDYAFE
jgi:hypothetical protein